MIDKYLKGQKLEVDTPLNLSVWPGACECGGLFPVHAMLNHSDSPNAFVSDRLHIDPLVITIVALRDIKQGEEITIDYFYSALNPSGAGPMLNATEEAEVRKRKKADYLID